MKIWRYKNYNFEKEMLPLGSVWKEPQVQSLEAPDSDYILHEGKEEKVILKKEKIKENIYTGIDYVLNMTAEINVLIEDGDISVIEGTGYAVSVDSVIKELQKGYWHSAYYEHIKIIPTENLQVLHEEVKLHIKEYVNNYYSAGFKIN